MSRTDSSNSPAITPHPGYILCKPYIEKDKTFIAAKEQDGLDQRSEILAIGQDVLDSYGVLRKPYCKVGDVILNAYSNKEFELDFTKYRFVHFSEIHGIYATTR